MVLHSRHILICRTDNIGDVVLTLPIAAGLKQLIPNCKISFLCRRYASAIVSASQDVDNVILLEEVEKNLTHFFRQSDIDTIIFAQPHQKIAKAAFINRIRYRIGNAKHKLYLRILCNHRIHFNKRTSPLHESQINFHFLAPFGITEIPSLSDIAKLYRFTSYQDHGVDSLLKPYTFNLILHIKSNGSGREWPVQYYAQLIEKLQSTPGLHIWLTGSMQEGNWITEHAPDLLMQKNVTPLFGQLSLAQLFSFIQKADGLIASGTGPLHIASALNKKVLGLFPPAWPMHPGRWSAMGDQAHNLCTKNGCVKTCAYPDGPTCACMQQIKPESVSQVVKQWYIHSSSHHSI